MPWLSRRSSQDSSAGMDCTMQAMRSDIDGGVTFVPAIMDASCGTMPTHHRRGPVSLVVSDIEVMLRNTTRCLPEMVRSLWTADLGRSIVGSLAAMDIMDISLQITLGFLELCMITAAIPAFIMLPGLMLVPIALICAMVILFLCWPLNGEQVIRCSRCSGRPSDDTMAEERWFHINGSMTSSRHMLQHLDRLSATFGRRITGIHNRTYGPVLDVILPVLLSIFNINTSTSKALHTQLREAMLSQSCGKVIIIAHGTGASILSEVMDRLHCDMPLDTMSKIEIYTFGSAARHMSNPCMIMNRPFDMSKISRDSKRDSIQTMRLEENERVIPYIEHYAMTTDLTANCGIMHHTMNVLDNRFCGRTFLVSRPGFLFDQYMDMLFPQISTAKRSSSHMSLSSGGILDTVAEVDSTMVEKREFTALGIHGTAMNGMKRMSLGRGMSSISSINIPGVLSLEDMAQMVKDGKLVAGEAKAETRTDKNGKTMNGTHADAKEKKDRKQNLSMSMGSPVDGVTIAKCAAKECEGKSVRDLSRLWQYQNGRRPAGEGDLLKMGERLMGGLMNGLGMINPTAARP